MSSNPPGPLVVVSGPSGVGKTTVAERLLAVTPLPLRRAVTATTRDPRPGEVDGRDYHFWTESEFRKAIDDGLMLEYAVVHGKDFYGTPRSEVDPHRAAGTGVVLVIDVQGAEQVRRVYPADHLSLFLTAPSFDDLERRLRLRGDSDAAIARRLETARGELARAGEFDRVILNHTLDETVQEVHAVLRDLFAERGLGR